MLQYVLRLQLLPERMLTATEYICAVGVGVTKPAFLRADDGQIYVVKFARRPKDFSWLISEYLAAAIGSYLKLPFPAAGAIFLDNEKFHTDFPTAVHFASRYQDGCSYIERKTQPHLYNARELSGVALFDAFFLNGDRMRNARNLLLQETAERQRLIAIDHSHLFHSLSWRAEELASLSSEIPPFPADDWKFFLGEMDVAEDLQYYSALLAECIEIYAPFILHSLPDAWLTDAKKIRSALADFCMKRLQLLPFLQSYIYDELARR